MPETAHWQRGPLANLSLRWIVAAGYALALAVTLSLMGFLLHHLIERYLLRSAEVRLMETMWALHPPPPGGPPRPLELSRPEALDLVDKLRREGIAARLLDGQCRVLSSPESRADGFPVPTPEELARANPRPHSKPINWKPPHRRHDGPPPERPHGTRQGDVLVTLVRVGNEPLFLQMGTFWGPSRDFLSALAEMLVTSILCALVVGLLISFWLARLLARPLERVAATAHRVAAGDLTARTRLGSGTNEIAAVSTAFDAMVQQLEEAFATQRRFVADASHELRSPLTSISGVTELLPDATEEERRRSLTVLEREVARMNRLVDDLLTLSRTESGEEVLRKEPLDLSEVAREAVEVVQLAAPSRQFELALETPVPLTGDRESLLRALRNVLENAVAYSPADRPIRVASRAGELTVIDRGPGVPAEDLPRLFERFFRSDRSRARRTGGSGLGLSIVQALVEAHGGRVTLESQPGQGTTVTFRFPVERQDA